MYSVHFFEELRLWNQRETLICRLEMHTLGHFLLQMQDLEETHWRAVQLAIAKPHTEDSEAEG